jgi:hypothetical protein
MNNVVFFFSYCSIVGVVLQEKKVGSASWNSVVFFS